MATHSSVLAWRIPGTVEPGGLPSMGLHRVRHDWSDLAAAAAILNEYFVQSKSKKGIFYLIWKKIEQNQVIKEKLFTFFQIQKLKKVYVNTSIVYHVWSFILIFSKCRIMYEILTFYSLGNEKHFDLTRILSKN